MNLDFWEECKKFLDVAAEYVNSPEEYVRFFEVTINGKLRHLVTYKPDEKGKNLRKLHSNFAKLIESSYRHAHSSFAYKKGECFLSCVQCHLEGEYFLKTDIHSYFESITYDNMIKRIHRLRLHNADLNEINLITKACFYNGHLPLGFSSSPVLSDLFLSSLDRKYQKNKEIIYTRYADDFIISAKGPNAQNELNVFLLQLEKDLASLDLELNKKKTYVRHLKECGDAIHVLGVNIVRTEQCCNRITISE